MTYLAALAAYLPGGSAMKRFLAVTTVAGIWLSGGACAAGTCDQGEKMLRTGEPCMPSHLVNYLYCLEKSGGGKVEFTDKSSTNNSSQLQISIGGKASGVFVKGSGDFKFSKAESQKTTKELDTKLDPNLTANCKALSLLDAASIFASAGGPEPIWPENLKQYKRSFALLKFTAERTNGDHVEVTGGGIFIAPGVIATSAAAYYVTSAFTKTNSVTVRTIAADGSLSKPRPVSFGSVIEGGTTAAIFRLSTIAPSETDSYIADTSDLVRTQWDQTTLQKGREIVVFLPDYQAGKYHVTYGKIVDPLNATCNVPISLGQDGAPVFTKDTGQFVGLLVAGQAFAIYSAYARAQEKFDAKLDFSDSAQISTGAWIRSENEPYVRRQPPAANKS